ncbi:MAG: hypothetical protein PHW69_04790 [Elusimicrobiaceae bacterium]|nr:hypothetical protein [Elusimicrobiaceae bacterium]
MMRTTVKRRTTRKFCPVCKREKLVAAELPDSTVLFYECAFCGEYYDSLVHVDQSTTDTWRLGLLRNPEFWNFTSRGIDDHTAEMNRRLQAGIPQYFGAYAMEQIPNAKR